MTEWIAPDVDRTPTTRVGDERTLLESWLDHHRDTLLLKCAGLTEAQLKQRSVEPSTLTLLGLVRHMAEVERGWFRIRSAGQHLPFIYCSDTNPDGDFDDVPGADAEADLATFRTEIELVREAMTGVSLEHEFSTERHTTINVRWTYLHLIEEYARHNGHADLLRERIDGVTGA